MRLADSTVAAVLALALHANFVGDYLAARHHLDGLHGIVSLKTVEIGMLSQPLHGQWL